MGYLYSCNKNVPEFLVLSENSLELFILSAKNYIM